MIEKHIRNQKPAYEAIRISFMMGTPRVSKAQARQKKQLLGCQVAHIRSTPALALTSSSLVDQMNLPLRLPSKPLQIQVRLTILS